ncbi:hypothetical protein Fmac_013994 [Flemingia macrophylla]|uniref:Peroxidase n=1 Tax=Flemingia macrophylla TaxID=520843 RepID=A0ABD1MAG7_9FABA
MMLILELIIVLILVLDLINYYANPDVPILVCCSADLELVVGFISQVFLSHCVFQRFIFQEAATPNVADLRGSNFTTQHLIDLFKSCGKTGSLKHATCVDGHVLKSGFGDRTPTPNGVLPDGFAFSAGLQFRMGQLAILIKQMDNEEVVQFAASTKEYDTNTLTGNASSVFFSRRSLNKL